MHRIRKQTVELSIDPQLDAVAMQARLSRACRSGGLLELDRVFDRLAGDKTVRIDRLELDLGDIGDNNWLPEFSRRLAECAEQTLVRAASETQPASGDGDQPTGSVESLTELSPGQERFEALTALLRSGRLPWWSDRAADQAWVRRQCAALTKTDKRGLIELAARNHRVLQRLVIHLPAAEIGQLLGDGLPSGLADQLATTIAALESQLALPAMRVSEWHAAYWRPFFRFVEARTARLEPKVVIDHWFASLTELRPGLVERLPARLNPTMPLPALPREWQQAFAAHLRRGTTDRERPTRPVEPTPDAAGLEKTPPAHSPEAPAREPTSRRVGQTPDAAAHDERPAARAPTASTPTGPSAAKEATTPAAIPSRIPTGSWSPAGSDDAVELDVTATGMVLLHPFLGELFTHLELVDQGQFISQDTRQVAVQVLGYLAFGAQQRVEPELTLAKLLCGLPLDEVLLPVDLNAATRGAADDLLAAVLKHWAALKSSSVEWLRDQFILRGGRLRQVDAGWKLTVEGRAQDVLLARLPWGFGVISLPWMDGMLHVQWGD